MGTILLKESQLKAIIKQCINESLMKINENANWNGKAYPQFQKYYDNREGTTDGTIGMRGRKKIKGGNHPGTDGKFTEYNQKVNPRNNFSTSVNKEAMQQHKNGERDLNSSINKKERTGRTKSKYWE